KQGEKSHVRHGARAVPLTAFSGSRRRSPGIFLKLRTFRVVSYRRCPSAVAAMSASASPMPKVRRKATSLSISRSDTPSQPAFAFPQIRARRHLEFRQLAEALVEDPLGLALVLA